MDGDSSEGPSRSSKAGGVSSGSCLLWDNDGEEEDAVSPHGYLCPVSTGAVSCSVLSVPPS